jgi:S-formylglutathione hydrolase
MSLQTKASISSFGGKLLQLTHNASTTQCEMAFHLYLPPQPNTITSSKIPLLIYLAGFTCTPDNGAEKGFFQHAASKEGIAVLYPDTSPRMITFFFLFLEIGCHSSRCILDYIAFAFSH